VPHDFRSCAAVSILRSYFGEYRKNIGCTPLVVTPGSEASHYLGLMRRSIGCSM
jgi:hypothetical protein